MSSLLSGAERTASRTASFSSTLTRPRSEPEIPFVLSVNQTLEDAYCLVGLAPAAGGTSDPFEVSGRRFQLKVAVQGDVKMKLQSLDASTKAEVYVQCRLGLMSFTTEARESALHHCLFTNPAPWGRSVVVCSADTLSSPDSGYTALRGVDAEHLANCMRVEVVMKVPRRGPMGGYTIKTLPVASHPAPSAELKDALEDGSWTHGGAVEVVKDEAGEQENAEAEGRTLRVASPAWRYHNVVWSKGIPHVGVPRIWEAQVKVTHAADETFGSLRVGVIPLSRYVSEGPDILDLSASINQEGTAFVTRSAIVEGQRIEGNVAVVTIRVDRNKNTICWKVAPEGGDGVVQTASIPLSKDLLLGDLHPFVSLNYLGDTVAWLRGGVVPSDEEQMALDVHSSAEGIFDFCDTNDSGVLEADEVTLLVERTQREALRALGGMRREEVVSWYEANGHAVSDKRACCLMRSDPSDGTLKHRDAFADPQQWADAELEVLPEVEPMRKKLATDPPAEGEELPEPQYRTRAEFKSAGVTDEEWFSAEVEPEPGLDGEAGAEAEAEAETKVA